MAINLSDLTVMVTRPNPGGEILCAYIESFGGHALNFPTMEFAPVENQELFQADINTLGKQDWIIFVSPQAVYSSIVALRTTWPHLAENVKFAAVGAGTAHALRDAGYVATYPVNDWSSEGLLELPEFHSVEGKNIAIICGDGGRDLLASTLSMRGATVSRVVTYQRKLPQVSQNEMNKYMEMLRVQSINAIVCTSFEGVHNLKIIFGEIAWVYLKEVPLIVMSERIVSLAHELGFKKLFAVHNASLEAILEMLDKKKEELCQKK